MNWKLLVLVISLAPFSHTNAKPETKCYYSSSTCGPVLINEADRNILIQLKTSLYSYFSSPFGDWNTSLTCSTGWTGVCTNGNGRVTEISIPSFYLDGNLPASFGSLSELKYLDLSGNLLYQLPSSFGSLKRLHRLNLNSNTFNETVLPVIAKLTALQYLNMGSNILRSLPSSLASLSNLTFLDLSTNYFYDNILPTIAKLTSLTHLDLSLNYYADQSASLAGLSKLRYLDLSYNPLSPVVIQSLGLLTLLEYLDLSLAAMRGSFPTTFQSMSKLSTLLLSYNHLCGSIPTYLSSLPNLKNFSVSYNYLTGPVPRALESKFCSPGVPSFTGNCLTASSSSTRSCLTSKPSYFCGIKCSPIPNLADDLASDAQTSQSSTFWYGRSNAAVDGSAGFGNFLSRSCTHTRNQTNPYLKVHLAYTFQVKTVQLYNRLDCCSNRLNGVQVYVGSSGVAYNAPENEKCLNPGYNYNEGNKGFPLNVSCNLDGSFVWVVLPGEGRVLSICEIVVLRG